MLLLFDGVSNLGSGRCTESVSELVLSLSVLVATAPVRYVMSIEGIDADSRDCITSVAISIRKEDLQLPRKVIA